MESSPQLFRTLSLESKTEGILRGKQGEGESELINVFIGKKSRQYGIQFTPNKETFKYFESKCMQFLTHGSNVLLGKIRMILNVIYYIYNFHRKVSS